LYDKLKFIYINFMGLLPICVPCTQIQSFFIRGGFLMQPSRNQ